MRIHDVITLIWQIAVTPTLIVTSENAMLRFTPAERDCYSEDEISLKYLPRDHGYRYEMSNCLFESAFENILEKCKCFPGKTLCWEQTWTIYGPQAKCGPRNVFIWPARLIFLIFNQIFNLSCTYVIWNSVYAIYNNT